MHEPVRTTIADDERPGKLSLHLVETLAKARGTSPDDLDVCLHDHIDVSALAALFRSSPLAPSRGGSISFSVEELLLTVSVETDGDVEISAEPLPAESTGATGRGLA